MEFISSSDLKKYEDIINEINQEYEKNKQLAEELEQESNNIVIHNLIRSESIKQLSHLNVKVFGDITEIFSLYSEDIRQSINNFSKEEDCKFYLVEIYISEEFLSKLRREDWFVNVSIQNNNFCVSKSVKLKKNTIFDIFSIPENVIECKVEAYLINTTNEWIFVKLDKVEVDISYHFQKFKRKQKFASIDHILQLTSIYNKNVDIKVLKEVPFLTYEVRCTELNNLKFVEMIIKNAYHSLDMEMFSDLQNDNGKGFFIQIYACFDKIEVFYDRKGVVKFNSNFVDLELLKKYLIKISKQNDEYGQITGVEEVKNAVVSNPKNAINLYSRLRKLSSSLPISIC